MGTNRVVGFLKDAANITSYCLPQWLEDIEVLKIFKKKGIKQAIS
jgi:hypothetical protein